MRVTFLYFPGILRLKKSAVMMDEYKSDRDGTRRETPVHARAREETPMARR